MGVHAEADPGAAKGRKAMRVAQSRNAWEQAWLDGWLDSDQRFHDALFDLAANKRARQVIRTCNVQWHRLKLGMLTLEGRVERSVAEHDQIAGAILSGSAAG